jgi:hypothetical protein
MNDVVRRCCGTPPGSDHTTNCIGMHTDAHPFPAQVAPKPGIAEHAEPCLFPHVCAACSPLRE